MLFNSIEFLLFFPIVTILFYLIPHKFRWILLLAASCVFYMWFVPEYIFIAVGVILISYFVGIFIKKNEANQRKKKNILTVGIVLIVLILFIFKYLAFIHENLIAITERFGLSCPDTVLKIILPIGLSFYTFQCMSYMIEVYRDNQKVERNFGIFSLYVMFYPQLVTGPIERPSNMLTQLHQEQQFDYDNIAKGLRLILFGMFIKMAIADNLAFYADKIYADPKAYNSWSIMIGMIFYSFQIYCDFFGYSTIALGCAKTMGYNITNNFQTPYLAKSIREFWQRWHISLSTWFRDYLYIPLGGSRVKIQRWMINMMIVFVISGFWHGANWTFILWGACHGLLQIIENLLNRVIHIKDPKNKVGLTILNFFRIAKTFLFVTFFWMMFRATDFQNISDICSALLTNFHVVDDFSIDTKMWILLAIFCLFDIFIRKSRFDEWCGKQNVVIRWGIYALLIFLTIVFASVENLPFIYFQF